MFEIRQDHAAGPAGRIAADTALLAAEDLDGWTADALSERLVELAGLRERLDAELARVTARWYHTRAWEADAALSPVPWLTARAGLAAGDARQLVRVARVVQSAPTLAASLAEGDTTAAHVGVLARVASPQRRPLLADHDEVLTKQAERLSVTDFTRLARRWATLADDHLTADRHPEAVDRNELRAGVTVDGWVDGTFHLDPVAGKTLLDALDQLAPPDPTGTPEGPRSLPERRGDALADLASQYQTGDRPGGNPPNLNVVVDVATLTGGDIDLARTRCDLDGIGPVTRATLEQLGCGATLTRIVMAGPSVILDMGRRTRLATPQQTRAVKLRDRGCVFDMCDRPPEWCDIHHLDSWAHGGRTDLNRLVTLCRRHHTLIHQTDWTIRSNPDGTFTACHPARAP